MPSDERCEWCGRRFKPGYKWSGWEQYWKDGIWKPLCVRCANRRLDNPYNALLKMRKVDHAE